MGDNHYVLVIHGTWNPPDSESTCWYQLNEKDATNFCCRLNDRLEQLGMGRVVWRPWGNEQAKFAWSGANRHPDRVAAAHALFELLQTITSSDPSARISLVAHSHGANVVLKALEEYLSHLHSQALSISDEVIRARFDGESEGNIKAVLKRHFKTHADLIEQRTTSLFEPLRAVLSDRSDLDRRRRASMGEVSDTSVRKATSRRWQVLRRLRLTMRDRALGQDARAARDAFVASWVHSPAINRIGRLVFLGAPFFSKQWFKRSRWSPAFLLGNFVDAIVAVVAGIALGYFVVEYVWTFIWGIGALIKLAVPFEFDLSPTLNPLAWPGWVQGIGAFYLLGGFTLVFSEYAGWDHRDVNVYFDDLSFAGSVSSSTAVVSAWATTPVWRRDALRGIARRSSTSGRGWGRERNFPSRTCSSSSLAFKDIDLFYAAVPFDTLVVHAGLLDEVLLGFSAEPLVFGTLVPQIRALLYPPVRFSVEDLPIGRRFAPRNVFTRSVSAAVRYLFAAAALLIRPATKLWERYLTAKLLQIISGPAFGLPLKEFSQAIIVARQQIDLPRFFRETIWDVSSDLMSTPSNRDDGRGDRVQRYGFLWDEKDRERRKDASWLWGQLERSMVEIERRHSRAGRLDPAALLRTLADTSLVLEERVKELAGVIELFHSAYYSNNAVMQGLANFIAHGTLGAEESSTSQGAAAKDERGTAEYDP